MFSPHLAAVRLSRIFRPDDSDAPVEPISIRRAALWVVLWIGILAGIVLYFIYARLLVPLF